MLVLWPALSLSFPIPDMSGLTEQTISNHVSGLDFLGWIPFQTFYPHKYLLRPQVQILEVYQWGCWFIGAGQGGSGVFCREIESSHTLLCSSAVWWMRWISPPWIWMMHSGSSNPISGFRVRPRKWNDSSKPSGVPTSHS